MYEPWGATPRFPFEESARFTCDNFFEVSWVVKARRAIFMLVKAALRIQLTLHAILTNLL